jgi:hypothetical protein
VVAHIISDLRSFYWTLSSTFRVLIEVINRHSCGGHSCPILIGCLRHFAPDTSILRKNSLDVNSGIKFFFIQFWTMSPPFLLCKIMGVSPLPVEFKITWKIGGLSQQKKFLANWLFKISALFIDVISRVNFVNTIFFSIRQHRDFTNILQTGNREEAIFY